MFTNDEMDRLYEKIFALLLKGGWLRNFSRTEGKGFHLGWNERGALLAIPLKHIITAYRLIDGDRTALAFDKLARGESLPAGLSAADKLDAKIAAFWCQCIDELQIPRTADDLLIFAHIIDGWAPDGNTTVKVG